MRVLLKIFFLLLLPALSFSQQYNADSVRRLLLNANHDSVRYKTAIQLYDYYEELNSDSAVKYATLSASISRQNKKLLNLAYSLNRQAYQEKNLSRYDASLQHLLEAFTISQNKSNEKLYWELSHCKQKKRKDYMYFPQLITFSPC